MFGLTISSCEKQGQILVMELNISELVCADGQRIFEGRILDLEGIKSVTANIQTQKAQIKYRDQQVSAQQIETHLSDYGFTIDGVPGNNIARNRLPSCCRAGEQ